MSEDIHIETAAMVYGVDPARVTPEMRTRVKNAGLIYVTRPVDVEVLIDARMITYDNIVGGGTRARRRYLAKLCAKLRGQR